MATTDEHMLSTVDNPYNPFTDFSDWYRWDMNAGYNTLDLLGRVIITSDELSDADRSLAIEQAINEITTENVSGMHIAVLDPRTSDTAEV